MIALIPTITILLLVALLVYAHFRISRRMGFGIPASLLIAVSSLLGAAVILWWCMDWPNERESVSPDVFE
ncbi:MAG: hypothetical protein AAGB10_16895 [Pseudomonadota bacterium]